MGLSRGPGDKAEGGREGWREVLVGHEKGLIVFIPIYAFTMWLCNN